MRVTLSKERERQRDKTRERDKERDKESEIERETEPLGRHIDEVESETKYLKNQNIVLCGNFIHFLYSLLLNKNLINNIYCYSKLSSSLFVNALYQERI